MMLEEMDTRQDPRHAFQAPADSLRYGLTPNLDTHSQREAFKDFRDRWFDLLLQGARGAETQEVRQQRLPQIGDFLLKVGQAFGRGEHAGLERVYFDISETVEYMARVAREPDCPKRVLHRWTRIQFSGHDDPAFWATAHKQWINLVLEAGQGEKPERSTMSRKHIPEDLTEVALNEVTEDTAKRLAPVLTHTPPPTRTKVVRRWAQLCPASLAVWLQNRRDRVGDLEDLLAPEDLQPLMQSENAHARQTAIRLISHLSARKAGSQTSRQPQDGSTVSPDRSSRTRSSPSSSFRGPTR